MQLVSNLSFVVKLWFQERLLVQQVKSHLGIVSHDDLMQHDLADYLLTTTSDLWQHCQVSPAVLLVGHFF